MRTLVNMNEISDFSRRFSAALQGVMRENKVTVGAVAELMGKSKGFVSTHTSGKAAPDTDLIDAVATLSNMPTRDLIIEVARRMRNADVHVVGIGSVGSAQVERRGGKTAAEWVEQGDVFYVDSSVFANTYGDGGRDTHDAWLAFVRQIADDQVREEIKDAEEHGDLHLSDEDFRQLEAIANGHDGKPIDELKTAIDFWWSNAREGLIVAFEAKGYPDRAPSGSLSFGAKPHPSDIDEDAIAADDQDREKDTMK